MTPNNTAQIVKEAPIRVEGGGARTWLGPATPIFLALLVAALVAAAAGTLFHGQAHVLSRENPYLWMMESSVWRTPPVDKRSMLLAHKVFLGMLAIFVLLFQFMPLREQNRLRKIQNNLFASLASVCTAAFFIYALVSINSVQDCVFGVILAVALAAVMRVSQKIPGWLPTSFMFVAIATVTLVGLMHVPDFTFLQSVEVVQLQQHYTVTMLLSDKLAGGFGIHPQMSGLYNALPSLLLGLIEKASGIGDFGTSVHIVEMTQFFLLVGAAIVYLRHGRTNSAFYALLAMVPLLCWYNCRSPGWEFPNHSGWRWLGCVLALLIVQSLKIKSYPRISAICGGAAALALLSNFETGIAACVSIAAYVFLSRGRSSSTGVRQWVEMIAPFGAAFAGTFAVFIVLFQVSFGCPPYFLSFKNLVDALSSSSLTSIGKNPSLFSLVIFAQAAFVLLQIAQKPAKEIHSRQAFRALLATFLLTWEVYYFVRPYPNNLASIFIFYGPLLIDTLRRGHLLAVRPRKQALQTSLVTVCFLALLVMPTMISDVRTVLPSWKLITGSPTYSSPKNSSLGAGYLFSGVFLPADLGAFVYEKCDYLQRLNKLVHPNYLSIYSFAVPKGTHLYSNTPFLDPYFGVMTPEAYDLMVSELMKNGPHCVVIDDPDADPALKNAPWFKAFIESINKRLNNQNYALTAHTNGWLVFEK